MLGTLGGGHIGLLRARRMASTRLRSVMFTEILDISIRDVSPLASSSLYLYCEGSGRSHPSTFMKPQATKSTIVSVKHRLVSTGLVKNVSKMLSIVLYIGSS